jgi:hypothetical protein
MRSSILLFVPTLVLLGTAPGCVRPGVGAAVAARAIVAYEVAGPDGAWTVSPEREWTTENGDPLDDDGSTEEALAHVPLAVPPPGDPPAPLPTKFDMGGAYGALSHVDLAACKEQGLRAGYGRVLLGFEPDGRPVGVSIEMPAGSTPEARSCVEQAFRTVRVAPFEGAPVNVRRAFFVGA